MLSSIPRDEIHTHGNTDAEKAADHLVDDCIQIFVTRLPAIDFVIGIIPQAQTKEIWLCDNEVEVLIKDLCNILRCAGSGYLRSKVLEEGARDRG